MLPILLLAFVLVPIIELAVILEVGRSLGVWPTVIILLADSLLGAVLVRREGRRAWSAFRRALEQGRWPGDEVTQGALVLIGGALLLTPGFVTDAAGLLAVLPPTRALASRLIRRRLRPAPLRGRATRRPPGRRPEQREVLDVQVVGTERERPSTSDAEDRPDPDRPR